MKSITSCLVGAAVLALAGGAFLAAGRLDRELAHAQEHIATLDFEEPAASFEKAERYFEYASLLPWIGNGPLNDVRARKAELEYRQGRFGGVVPEQTDPVGALPPDNVALQFVVAHSVYRAGQALAKDRESAFKALDAGIEAYLTVLRNATRHEPAAYNYEYLVRLREEIEKGRRKADLSAMKPEAALGHSGAAVEAAKPGEFKLLVPLDSVERDKAGAGKAAPLKRKG